jgi:hypothetical protein
MATNEDGEEKAKGLAGVTAAVMWRILAGVRGLYDRSAPWLLLVSARGERQLIEQFNNLERPATSDA